MRSRLLFASLAIAVVAGLIGWGLTPSAVGSRAAGSGTQKKSPYQLAVSVPASVSKMRLAFMSFAGSRNTKVWSTCYPTTGSGPVCSNFSNPEREWYQASQVQVYGGGSAPGVEEDPHRRTG